MERTIIVPVDGSEDNEQALVPAKVLARVIGAKLVLLYAAISAASTGEDTPDDPAKADNEVETYLSGLANRIKAEGIDVETATSNLYPSSAILLEINLRWADMVVMCAQRHSGLKEWFSGSVIESVILHSPVPVLVVEPDVSLQALQLGSSTSPLLVPLDGSKYAETALSHAVALAGALGRNIALLRVVDANNFGIYAPQTRWNVPVEAKELTKIGAMTKWKIQTAADYLTSVEDRLNLEKGRVHSTVRLGRATEAIQEEGKATNAGMIIMATHGRTGLQGLMMGSVALKEVQVGSLPIHLVPPGELVKTKDGILDTRQPDFSR